MKLKIVSDGTAAGTQLTIAETGEPIGGVQALTWSASADGLECEALVHLIGVPCDIVAEVGMMALDDILEDPTFPVSDDPGEPIDISDLLKRK